uniref:Uncharacterized protein n=1 Tax=Acrobeloides nanus TaxID=290746 RepID=A0A914ENX4_9BILA
MGRTRLVRGQDEAAKPCLPRLDREQTLFAGMRPWSGQQKDIRVGHAVYNGRTTRTNHGMDKACPWTRQTTNGTDKAVVSLISC